MAEKVLLKNSDGVILPITRGELILDSSGNKAFHSEEFLATDSQPGLMSAQDKLKIDSLGETITYDPGNVSLNQSWSPVGVIFSRQNGFSSGSYIIKIASGSLIFSGIMSIFEGEVNVSDEIVLHMNGFAQTYIDGIQGRIYAKIAKGLTTDYGQLYLATNVPQTGITSLSITMKKLI